MSEQQAEASSGFEEHRRLLTAVAYRVLGSMTDAEDVVQEAWLRWSRTKRASVRDPRAFLVRVATRLALDRLRRVKTRREAYVGPWLPEPILTADDPAEEVALAESVSMAMLVLLETLSPLERAVFVLRESFGMSHAEIAEVLGRREEAIRQLARRARDHVRQGDARYEADQSTRQRVTERFLAAALGGDLDALMGVLAPGVTLVADGGGRAPAPRRPLHGADKVARFLLAIAEEQRAARFLEAVAGGTDAQIAIRVVQLNGEPGIVVTAGGTPVTALVLGVDGERVATLLVVANPEKLLRLRLAVA